MHSIQVQIDEFLSGRSTSNHSKSSTENDKNKRRGTIRGGSYSHANIQSNSCTFTCESSSVELGIIPSESSLDVPFVPSEKVSQDDKFEPFPSEDQSRFTLLDAYTADQSSKINFSNSNAMYLTRTTTREDTLKAIIKDPRVPLELQGVFLASNRGEEVHVAPSRGVIFRRKWFGEIRKTKKEEGSRHIFFGIGKTFRFDNSKPPNAREVDRTQSWFGKYRPFRSSGVEERTKSSDNRWSSIDVTIPPKRPTRATTERSNSTSELCPPKKPVRDYSNSPQSQKRAALQAPKALSVRLQ